MLQSEDLDAIEAAVSSLRKAGHITEIELRQGENLLRLRRPIQPAVPSPPTRPTSPPTVHATELAVTTSVPGVATPASLLVTTVTAHLVGVFHAAVPSPVSRGDVVKEGQLLGQIESMRLMNDCSAPHTGRVTAILVEDGQPVEYGQPLFEILPEELG